MEVPSWLKKTVSAEGLEQIQKAVEKAELTTSGEIVPMIAHRSINTGHVSLVLFLAHVLVLWSLIPYVAPVLHQVPIWIFEVGAIVIAAVSSWLQRDLDLWDRWFTTKEDQALSVLRRAQLEFYQSNIKETEGKTGVLIFVSLLEHRAVILADKAISDLLPADTWDHIVQGLIAQVKAGDFARGMSEAIEKIGTLLTEKFPLQPGDRNELPNHLIVKE